MMRAWLLCFVWLATAPVAAQWDIFEIYSGCTNYTSRGTLGVNAGEVLTQVPASHFAGVAADAAGTGTFLHGFNLVYQDQNWATQETYSLVVRADVSGTPDCSNAGLLLRVGPFTTPWTGFRAWNATHQLATPSTVLPACGTFYYGAELTAAPAWTADGQSIHIQTYRLVGGSQGDNPADNAPGLAWDCIAGVARQPSTPRAARLNLLVAHPVLNLGNVDPVSAPACIAAAGNRSFGAGGLWPASENPNSPRNDGLDVRVRDLRLPDGLFATFLGTPMCPGIPVPGLARGVLLLQPGLPMVPLASGALGMTGEGTATILPPGSRVTAGLRGVEVPIQAVTISPTTLQPLHLTNRASATYLP